MIYRLDTFPESPINPVTGEAYDDSWRILALTDSPDYQQMCGSSGGAYTVRVSRRKCPDWELAAGDFTGYCEANGINAILVMTEAERKAAEARYAGHRYDEPFLRAGEPPVLVHSTPLRSWEQIQRDGMLKSWNRLKAEQAILEDAPVGALLGDPADFRGYIMFGGGITGEIVVNAKQRGRIVMDPDAEYLTGARLYFDAERMAEDGRLIRDGYHLKVKGALPLSPYLIWAATWETVGLPGPVSAPRIFAEQADRQFQLIFQHSKKKDSDK